jgi:hypothetical protein
VSGILMTRDFFFQKKIGCTFNASDKRVTRREMIGEINHADA